MFKTTVVYQETARAASNPKIRYIVNQGGTSSGKTYATIQLLFTLAMIEPNSIITIVGQDVPNLKKGAFRDAENIYKSTPDLQAWFATPIMTDRIFRCKNGSLLEFSSFTDEQDAKSGKRKYLFINEANGVPYNIFWQLQLRTSNKIFIDYNPDARFWVHDEVIGKHNTHLIVSDHRHNTFLSEETHDMIESEKDKERFRVYSRGLTGKIDGLIFRNWEICEDLPEEYKRRWFGLDFGYTNHPTGLIEVRFYDGQLWLKEHCYSCKMTNPDISNLIKMLGFEDEEIIADSAEPKSIQEIKDLGCRIEGAIKGPDSIKIGVDILQRYKLNITRDSINLRTELGSYKWKKERHNNKLTNVPTDEFNHLIDALRYVAIKYLKTRREHKGPRARLLRKT